MALTVAELCVERGLNAQQLAERCGFDATRANAIVLGRWTPKPAERSAIAELFDVSVDDIRWGHSTPIQHLWGHGPT